MHDSNTTDGTKALKTTLHSNDICTQVVVAGSHKNLKTEFHDWFAAFHDSHSHMVSDMVMIVFHNMHDNHKLESCYSHQNKQFHDFSMTFWEIVTFQDFSMTFHDSNFFQDFPWPWEPWVVVVTAAVAVVVE